MAPELHPLAHRNAAGRSSRHLRRNRRADSALPLLRELSKTRQESKPNCSCPRQTELRGRVNGSTARPVSKGDFEMPIYQTGGYQVRPSGVDKVKQAIREFVAYVKANEPGTQMYLAWQQSDDPTR